MIDDRTRTHLQATGRWNTDRIARTAHTRHCRCGHPVLAGLDADTAALAVTCDPTPLTPIGELTALLNGHTTYNLTWTAGYQINPRSHLHITAHPAGTDPHTETIRSHICGAPPVTETMRAPIPEAANEKEPGNDQPPY